MKKYFERLQIPARTFLLEARELPTLVCIEKSLEAALHLDVGTGLWRDQSELVWNDWRMRSDEVND